jgi:hypothetical protein
MDRAKSSVEYPSRSPDLTPLDFYVCDGLKNTVCIGKPRTLQDRWHKIEIVSVAVPPAMLREVNHSVARYCRQCIGAGGHSEHLLV